MTPKQKKVVLDFLGWVWLILFLFILFLALIAATAKAETYYVTANGGLNLRWEPNKRSRVEAVAEQGEELEVTALDGQWATVQWGADTLYCSISYLSQQEPSQTNGQGKIASNGRVALRDMPGGKRVGWMHNGDKVSISGVVDGWCRTEKGYVAQEYVEMEEDYGERS